MVRRIACACGEPSVPEVPRVRIGTVASLALRDYARAVSTRRVVLVSLLAASACLGLANEPACSWRSVNPSLRQFVRAMGAFLQGMEHYVVREKPTSPVYAYEDITELTPENAGRLVSELQEFLGFYHEQCEQYGVAIPASHTGS